MYLATVGSVISMPSFSIHEVLRPVDDRTMQSRCTSSKGLNHAAP
jgi:hypothetical protein